MKFLSGIFIIFIVFFSNLFIFSEDNNSYVLSGEIYFTKKGKIYLELVTKKEYEDNKEDAVFQKVIEIGEDELKNKKISFSFENIPKGVYCLQGFLDTNNNGKLDIGMFGPKEHWGNYREYRPGFREPKFNETSFEINKNMENINLTLKL